MSHPLPAVPLYQPRFWPRALAGLTPRTIAVVLALLYVCALSIVLGRGARPDLLATTWAHFVLLLVGTAPLVLTIVLTGNLGPQRGVARAAALAAAIVLGFGLGTLTRSAALHAQGVPMSWKVIVDSVLFAGPRFLLVGALFALALEFFRHAERSAEAGRQAEVDRAALEHDWGEARLNVLRAQIEPHFLFNSLAHVRHLCDTDAERGRAMLDSLMAYLAAALPQIRRSESTLGAEADLAVAFLRVQQIRMGRRLNFTLAIPEALRPCRMPPMMLLTLVENAIKHGLQPAREGGTIRISAAADGEQWRLAVADSGVGLATGAGSGTGLSNVRARLAAEFAARASLSLQGNDLGGVTATIALPWTASQPARP
ncbi:MAG: histidine kinase [Ideonella sp.]|nr:histidine kinase [Ideonella sp.]MBP6776810.1 histidine kinase [Piscinibacter sp.]